MQFLVSNIYIYKLLYVCVCRVNKPYLPIAAGDLSVQSAWLLVLLFAVAGLVIVGINFGPFITSLYSLGLFLGTIYSVPPFRLKRFAIIAFLIIATVSTYFSFNIANCFSSFNTNIAMTSLTSSHNSKWLIYAVIHCILILYVVVWWRV